jgi:hypothetical protein
MAAKEEELEFMSIEEHGGDEDDFNSMNTGNNRLEESNGDDVIGNWFLKQSKVDLAI